MDFNTALKMTRMGVHMTRTEWGDDDLVLTLPDENLIVVASLTDPAVETSPGEGDRKALDWEVRRQR